MSSVRTARIQSSTKVILVNPVGKGPVQSPTLKLLTPTICALPSTSTVRGPPLSPF